MLVMDAPGYHRETMNLLLPHRGLWTECRFHLTPFRGLSFGAYHRWLALHGAEARVGWDTPRQIEAWLASHESIPRDKLGPLIRHYEHVFYGAPAIVGVAEHERFVAELRAFGPPPGESKS